MGHKTVIRLLPSLLGSLTYTQLSDAEKAGMCDGLGAHPALRATSVHHPIVLKSQLSLTRWVTLAPPWLPRTAVSWPGKWEQGLSHPAAVRRGNPHNPQRGGKPIHVLPPDSSAPATDMLGDLGQDPLFPHL